MLQIPGPYLLIPPRVDRGIAVARTRTLCAWPGAAMASGLPCGVWRRAVPRSLGDRAKREQGAGCGGCGARVTISSPAEVVDLRPGTTVPYLNLTIGDVALRQATAEGVNAVVVPTVA
jgi:hypothetical protein